MILLIDSREPKSIIATINSLNNSKYKIEIKQLDIGDYCFYCEDTQKYKVIIERKSLQDLESSIKDGRYNEQSLRLSNSSLHNHNIYYLIEGNIINKKEQQKNMLRSAVSSLSYFKGFSILNSVNNIDSAEIVYSFFDKINREKTRQQYYQNNEQLNDSSNENRDESSDLDYVSVVKNQKKQYITPENIMSIMLNQIPGISTNSSLAICSKFKNIESLINCIKNNPEELSEIYLTNNRKISKTVIENLSKFLVN